MDYFGTYRLGFIVNGLFMVVVCVVGLLHTHISIRVRNRRPNVTKC